MKFADYPPPSDKEVNDAIKRGSFSHLSPLEKSTRRNTLLSSVAVGLLVFFIGWMLAAAFWKYDIVEFAQETGMPVTAEQAQAYREAVAHHGPTDFLSFMSQQETPVFYWEDIMQFRWVYEKKLDLPVSVAVTLIPLCENGTTTHYIARTDASPPGEYETFYLTEQVRPGTVPCPYALHVVQTYQKPIGGRQKYVIHTGEFVVRERRELTE